jgi:hypothetical protein
MLMPDGGLAIFATVLSAMEICLLTALLFR